MPTLLRTLAVAVFALASTAAAAKSQTVRLEFHGPGLQQSIVITDATLLKRFTIWNGPGVVGNPKPMHLDPSQLEAQGAFIDWPKGTVVGPPRGALQFEVTFHQESDDRARPMHEWHRRYVIRYAFDSGTRGGRIYLPGPADGEIYRRNVHSINHSVEGNWFHSTAAWEKFIRPVIETSIISTQPTHRVERR